MSPKRVVLAIVLALGEVAEFRNLPKAALGIAR
jgi:hypothetical protein